MVDHPLWVSFGLGAAFGAAARLSRFCLLRGLAEACPPGPASPASAAPAPAAEGAPALRSFALALAVALVGTQLLAAWGDIPLERALPVRPQFSPWGALLGGLLFGIGMVLARGCAARALVLLAGGNLRALWVLLWLGLGAQASMTGVLAPLRQQLQGWGMMTLAHPTLDGWLQAWGLPAPVTLWLATGVPSLLLLAYALGHASLRAAPARWLGALVIGLCVAAGWWASAHVGTDPFDEQPLSSLSFISPVAEVWLYLQVAVGRELATGVMLVLGVLAGAAIVALVTRTARWESFQSAARMGASAAGGLLMGFGGVVALGCSIGQGLAGLSTLAIASLPPVIGIVAGACLMLRWQAVLPSTDRAHGDPAQNDPAHACPAPIVRPESEHRPGSAPAHAGSTANPPAL
ncbi:MAG: YeeE/YedE family protein [Lautropia sp.]|nr:YeeE/YedE family protein [Lautropia sp.]